MQATCAHLEHVDAVPPTGDGCVECMEAGDQWFHLRMCVDCGHVGCCDQSKNQHATKHFRDSGHPVIRSFQPGESWLWCYVDEVFVGPD